ncbi:MAG: tetratricopeptide repeat protein, partial [Flavobacteriaceae bacterium]|nr:tetratricopeptide repeat protein [Flavobacteriaceae bacterium]
MESSHQDDHNNPSLTRFESMLKTNNVLFFDSSEFENIIHYYLENGKIGLAKKAIKLGLEQHPNSTNMRLFKTEIFIIENRLDKADELLQELYELEPENEEIYIQKANVFSKNDEHVKAIKTLKYALDLCDQKTDADILSLIGMEYLFMDRFKEAAHYFAKCLEIDIYDYSALYNIIFCLDVLDKNQEAVEFLNGYLETHPYCDVAWHQLGRQYATLKEYDKAIAAFDFAIISDEGFLGAYLEKAKVLEDLNEYKSAIEIYKLTLKLEEPTSFALMRIGHCFEKLKLNDKAIKYYKKAVHEDPLLDKGW